MGMAAGSYVVRVVLLAPPFMLILFLVSNLSNCPCRDRALHYRVWREVAVQKSYFDFLCGVRWVRPLTTFLRRVDECDIVFPSLSRTLFI